MPLSERTWRQPPLMPPNAVQVFPIDPSTIRVTWRGVTPTPMEEPLIGYKVSVLLHSKHCKYKLNMYSNPTVTHMLCIHIAQYLFRMICL